jgi:hypothetical protein
MEHLTPQLMDRLLALGFRPDLDSLQVLEEFSDLRAQDWINGASSTVWSAAAVDLAIGDLAAVIRAVVTMENGWKLVGGSGASALWLLRRLKERDERVAKDVAAWILSRSNPFNPEVGSLARALLHGALVRENAESECRLRRVLPDLVWEQKKATWLQALLAECAPQLERRQREDERQRREDERQRPERERRQREIEQQRQEYQSREARRVEKLNRRRESLLAIGAARDPKSRLEDLSHEAQIPIPSLPPEWADVDDDILRALSVKVRTLLVQRLRAASNGRWLELRFRLERLARRDATSPPAD